MPTDREGAERPKVEIDSIDTQIETWTGTPVDGTLRLKEHRDGSTFKHILPFRTSDFANTPKQDPPPYVWLWDNPNEPISQLTLEPSYKCSSFHITIRDGVIVEQDG